jgi:multiple sugar transport system substrate-binding protein
MLKMTPTRRDVIKMLGGGVLFGALGPLAEACGFGSPAATKSSGGTFNPKQFAGTTLSVEWTVRPDATQFFDHTPDFTTLTGMQVQADILPQLQRRQKTVVQMNSQSPQPDLWQSEQAIEKRLFSKAHWYEPLNKYLADTSLVFPDWDRNDLSKAAWDMVTVDNGDIIGLPFDGSATIMVYRKDLFDAKGLTLNSLSDMEAAARELHDPPNVYGFVARGLKNANVATFAPFIYNYGGEYVDKNGNLAMTSSAVVQALTFYANLMKNYGPPGVVGYSEPEAQSLFLQGKAAMWVDGNTFMLTPEDPKLSKVVGKVGYALVPKGPAGSFAPGAGTYVSISPYSTQKRQAFLLAQWLMAKAQVTRALPLGASVLRASPWKDPTVVAALNHDWVNVWLQAQKALTPLLPNIVDVTQFRDIYGVAITNAILGHDPATELKAAQAQFEPIFTKDG